jgi:hypothetical protein
MLLARRFTLNPELIILALVFWFWMWGVPGAILAVPMLAILKIVCDRLRPLKAWGTSSQDKEPAQQNGQYRPTKNSSRLSTRIPDLTPRPSRRN